MLHNKHLHKYIKHGNAAQLTWYDRHQTCHIIHASPPLTSKNFKNGTPYVSYAKKTDK